MLENTNALIAAMLAIVHEKLQVSAEIEDTVEQSEIEELGYYMVDLEAALASLVEEYNARAAKDPSLPDVSQILSTDDDEDEDEDEEYEEEEAAH